MSCALSLFLQVLRFDETYLDQVDGPIPNPYHGLDLACTYGGCGYERASSFPRWTAQSSPNALYFYGNSPPTFTSTTNGQRLRLSRLYCTQAYGDAAQLQVLGVTDGQVS